MHHLAILKQPFLDKILSGEKTIESRWYKTRRAPWGRVRKGDTIWLKRSGGPVVAKATVEQVEQHSDLTPQRIRAIVAERPGLGGTPEHFATRYHDKRYGILIHLTGVHRISPFAIDKTGYGNQAAWITIERIDVLKAP